MEDHKKALLIVDMQYDFIPGGSLEVKGGDEIIQPINKLREKSWDLVVLTQDWHPDNHFSFHSNNPGSSLFQPFYIKDHDVTQVMWPNHCVQNTSGAELHKDLIVKDTDSRVKKG
jgi:nicotinamidase/pyrazinamidase